MFLRKHSRLRIMDFSFIYRLLWLFLLFLVKMTQVNSQQGFTLVKHVNMMQTLGQIKQLSVKSMTECFQHCISDCQCSEFDIRVEDMKCYLQRHQNETLKPRNGYNHFDITQKPQEHCDAFGKCRLSINCCLTSNPCYNNAKCEPTEDIRTRFKCQCPEHFRGKWCDKCRSAYTGKDCQTKITSCRGYANGSRIPGIYEIRHDDLNNTLKVFCDFEKDSNISWTLVQSYSMEHHRTYQKQFYVDFPQNVGNPPSNSSNTSSWFSYRLDKSVMELIQNDSTKWRITCDFDKSLTVIKTDFVQGLKADVNIMTFIGYGICERVDYINIRGYSCSNCTTVLSQTSLYPFYIDAKQSLSKCEFTVEDPKWCIISGEDSFGWYNCIHPGHRCSATLNSTTNTWLGG